MSGFNMKVTPQLEALTEICREHGKIDVDLYGKYDVKRGLRDYKRKRRSCRTYPDFQHCLQ